MIWFLIDPQHVKAAVLSGKCLLVKISGDQLQYRKVTVVARPSGPILPSNEAEAA
jgi:hypothetical protein